MYGIDSMTGFLEEVFEQRYPLFTRRLDFFRLTHTSGMQPSEYVAKMLQLSGEADLSSLTTDHLLVYQTFTGINEDNLFAKLMELEEPSFQDVSRKIASWEASKSAKRSVNQSGSEDARQVRGLSDPKNRPDPSQNTPSSIIGLCTKCGNKKHQAKDCPCTNLVCNISKKQVIP